MLVNRGRKDYMINTQDLEETRSQASIYPRVHVCSHLKMHNRKGKKLYLNSVFEELKEITEYVRTIKTILK